MGGRAGGGGNFGGAGGSSLESTVVFVELSLLDVEWPDDLSWQLDASIKSETKSGRATSDWRIQQVYVCGKIRHFRQSIIKPSEKMVVYSQTFLNVSLRNFAAQDQHLCTASHSSSNRKD